jgi:hypothetical protein
MISLGGRALILGVLTPWVSLTLALESLAALIGLAIGVSVPLRHTGGSWH